MSDDPRPAALRRATIRADLAHSRAGEDRSRRLVGFLILASLTLALSYVALWTWRFAFADLPKVPDAARLWSLNRPPGVVFLDRRGRAVGRRGPYHGPASALADMPAYLPRAFLAAEDRNFYSHHGLDWAGLARAARNDLLAGGRRRGAPLQGGSTLTQQLARTLFLSPEQTLKRKLQEAVLALELERRLSKDEILELYLNRIYFGGGAYGVQAAAQTYFAKPARALTLSEAALLAALPKAPTHLSPDNDYAAAVARSHAILSAMVRARWLSPAEAARAAARPPRLSREGRSEGDFGYVFDLAAKELKEVDLKGTPDLVVRLSVDADLEAAAADAVRQAVAAGAAKGASEGALVALGPDGAVLALVGGVDHRLSAFDRATQALRQPGSSFKPMVYAAALEAGLHAEDVRQDAPVRIGAWRPTNSDGRYLGPVTLKAALARSINTVAARIGQEVGPTRVAALSRRFGLLNIPAEPAAPIALGAYEVTLLDLASAYQVLQQEGRREPPYILASVANARGDLLWARQAPQPEQVFESAKADELVSMMEAVIQSGTGRRADIGRPAAGKTGTSQSYRDAWFVGFTPDLLAGVWLGDDRGRPMDHVAGGDLPAEAWSRFMRFAEGDAPPLPFGGLRAEAADAAAASSRPGERSNFYAALAETLADAAAAGPGPAGATAELASGPRPSRGAPGREAETTAADQGTDPP